MKRYRFLVVGGNAGVDERFTRVCLFIAVLAERNRFCVQTQEKNVIVDSIVLLFIVLEVSFIVSTN